MPDCDIIIPVFHCMDETRACLASVAEHTDGYRVILIDNGCTDAESKQLAKMLGQHEHTLIRNEDNLGFVKATNQGMAASTAPFVCLLNNDTEVVPDWLPMLAEPFTAHPSCGIVGPAATAGGWQARQRNRRRGYMRIGGSLNLAFFCALISRRVIDRIGFLDEDYGIGFGDDDDYCERAKDAGFRLYFRSDLVITHHHRTTFNAHVPEWEAHQDTNIRRFNREWRGRP